jgi:hypothetical protein
MKVHPLPGPTRDNIDTPVARPSGPPGLPATPLGSPCCISGPRWIHLSLLVCRPGPRSHPELPDGSLFSSDSAAAPHWRSAAAVHALAAATERGRANPRRAEELGARYRRLLQGIVAFHANVARTLAKFKLGKKERVDVLDDAITGLENTGSPALALAMRAPNANRSNPAPSRHRAAPSTSHETECGATII